MELNVLGYNLAHLIDNWKTLKVKKGTLLIKYIVTEPVLGSFISKFYLIQYNVAAQVNLKWASLVSCDHPYK